MPEPPNLFDDMARISDDDDPRDPYGARHQRVVNLGRGFDLGRAIKPHPMPCPPLGILMAFADETDRSISPRRRERIREHVRRCDECHEHVLRGFDEVVHGVLDILKDAHDVNQEELRRRESRFQHALHAQKISLIAPPLESRWRFERWLAAAGVAAIVTSLMLLRPAVAEIHAEEVITRAIAYERAYAAGSRQRIRQSLRSALFNVTRALPNPPDGSRIIPFSSIRNVVNGAVDVATVPANVSERDAHLALARLFAKHHFDWRKPFCLDCYRVWHGSLSRKRDTVSITGDMVLVRTTALEGELREVTLAFRRDSWRLVRQTFTFDGVGRVEFEELERQQVTPTPSAPTNQRASVTDARGREAVHTDAGKLPAMATMTGRPPAAGGIERGGSRRPGLSRWLARTFPKSAADARTAFLPNLEQRISSVRRHLIALQRFANLSSGPKAVRATDAERFQLRQRIELEYQTMRTHLSALESHLNLLVGTGTRSMESPTPLPDDWARRASEALPHATRLEYRLLRLFARDDLPPEETRVDRPESVRATFEALWESIQAEPHD